VQPEPRQRCSANQAVNRRATYAYIRDTVLASRVTAGQPLLASSASQLLAAAALAAFPNNALTDPTIEDRRDAHPDTLRRAVAFIDEHAHTSITTADIAAAAHVTIRTVQLAFRRYLDTTPTEYLRRVRLDHARQDLLAADPARESVTAVAYRWGFPGPSRFAAYYRQAYGVLPGATLRQR
jgi:transcriptional regulator GlxA family with amidase domain